MPVVTLEIPASEIQVGDTIIAYNAGSAWRGTYDLIVEIRNGMGYTEVGGTRPVVSLNGTYMQRVLREVVDGDEVIVKPSELRDGDMILGCRLIARADHDRWSDWRKSVGGIVVGQAHYTERYMQEGYNDREFLFKIRRVGGTRAPDAVCSCGRRVSGAMIAIGAVHLCP